MRRLLTQYREFDRPSRLLMINQLTINIGFYMLMPYLTAYLAGPIGLAGWAIGLVLGMRNFSQQGMFLLGGTLADRLGYKPLIVAGCLLRTGGFALLAVVESLPALVIASAATGFAGALFNPAVRAYLAADAGPRRVDAFAMFNVFYQSGILIGPVLGLALTAVDFRLTCLVAAGVFAVLTVLQVRALPQHRADPTPGERPSVLAEWRSVAANRSFLLFALVMIGSYVLTFQVYLALPLQARHIAGGTAGTALVTALFGVSGALAIAGQLRITGWFRERWSHGRCLAIGMCINAAAFGAPLLAARAEAWLMGAALLVSAALLALGTAATFPFEMDTIVRLSGNRLVATHYGLYNTIVGVGILLGNLFTGSVFDLAWAAGWPEAPWLGLTLLGLACAVGLHLLDRSRRLTREPVPV
jgi:MFS family permease